MLNGCKVLYMACSSQLSWTHFPVTSKCQYSVLCRLFFLSAFSCTAAGSSGRFRSPVRRWRDERNRTEFLFAPCVPFPPFSPSPPPPPPAGVDSSFLLLFSCRRLLITKVCCRCEGKVGGLDPFTRSPGAPGLLNPVHVTLRIRTSFGTTLQRRGNAAEVNVRVFSGRSLSEGGRLSASGSILGDTPFFSEE